MTITTTQREAALRYAGILEREARDHGSTDYKHYVAALLRELLAATDAENATVEPVQEPVAWCCLTPSGKIAYSDGKPMVMPGPVGNEVHRTPLYAHPQQRKPLTREQIDTVWSSLGSFTDRESDYRIFARAVERAHGITGEPT